MPVAELFGHEKVASTGTVHRVAYLERHRSTNISCDVLPTDVLVRRYESTKRRQQYMHNAFWISFWMVFLVPSAAFSAAATATDRREGA